MPASLFFRVSFSLFRFVGAMCFVISAIICTMLIEVLSEQPRSQFYMRIDSVAAVVLLLPAAVVIEYRMGIFVDGSVNL